MSSVQRAIAGEFRRVLKEQRLSVSAAARLLGVSRQSLHSYLSGTATPRPNVLNRAVELWSFHLTVGQASFDKSDFTQKREATPVATQLELSLWKKLDAISERDLHIAFHRDGKTLRVAVSIDIPA